MRRAAALLAALALAGCGEGGGDAPASPSAAAEQRDAGHIHGLGVDGGALYVATHHGLFRAAEGDRTATPVGEVRDLMGFTIAAGGRFLASGHPGPGLAEPPNLGLVVSADRGETWAPRSLGGEADLHVLRVSGETVYGFDATSGRLLVSTDGGTRWEERAPPGPLYDLAIDPRDPRRAVVASEDGLHVTRDGGRRWRMLNSGVAGLLAWPEPRRLLLLDPQGRVHASADGGRRFEEVGGAGGPGSAFVAASGDELYVALLDGQVRRSADAGASWSTRVTLPVPS